MSAAVLFLGLALLGSPPGATIPEAADERLPPLAARGLLVRGNQLYRQGDYAGAREAYLEGIDPRRLDPHLAYNLGVAAHRLGRLPEAIVWYRRSAARQADHRLRDNLEAARRALGVEPVAAGGAVGWLVERPPVWAGLRLAGIVAAWVAAACWLTGGRPAGGRAALAVALGAVVLFSLGSLGRRWLPAGAVLLENCGGLTAGTEVWVRDAPDGWRVVGIEPVVACPAAAVALVDPRR